MSENSETIENKDAEPSADSTKNKAMEDGAKFQDLIIKELSILQSQISQVHKDIQYSVAPKFLDISTQTNDLVELAIELWRLEHKINRILPTLQKDQQESLSNSMGRLKRYLEKNDIEVLDHTNEKYSDGQNLEILSVEKDPKVSGTIIKETKEPTILYKGEVIHIGKVILATKEETDSDGK